jgi:hypothetical protein
MLRRKKILAFLSSETTHVIKMLFPSVAIAGYLQSPVMEIKAVSSDKQMTDKDKIKKQVSIKV